MAPEQLLTWMLGGLIFLLLVFRIVYTRGRKRREEASRRAKRGLRPKPEITLFGGDTDDVE